MNILTRGYIETPFKQIKSNNKNNIGMKYLEFM